MTRIETIIEQNSEEDISRYNLLLAESPIIQALFDKLQEQNEQLESEQERADKYYDKFDELTDSNIDSSSDLDVIIDKLNELDLKPLKYIIEEISEVSTELYNA